MVKPVELPLQHDDHIWITWLGGAWAIERIQGKTFYLWRGYHPNIERAAIDTTHVDWEAYNTMAQEWLPSSEPKFTKTGQAVQPKDLADLISYHATILLCSDFYGRPGPGDWLVHERDRHLIVQALRALQKEWDRKLSGEPDVRRPWHEDPATWK